MNKKVINASPSEYNGIKFKSSLEVRTYKELYKEGFSINPNPPPIVLLSSFYPSVSFFKRNKSTKSLIQDKSKVRGITYTPDFILSPSPLYPNIPKVYIETKGFRTDSYNIKIKLFRKWLEDNEPNVILSEIYTLKELRELIIYLKSYEKIQ